MEPLSLIVTALVAGVASGLQPTATQAITDAYQGLKSLIKRKYTQANVELLESDPGSAGRQGVVKEDLHKAGAQNDAELLRAAQTLLAAVRDSEAGSAAARSVGVSLKDIEVGANLTFQGVTAGANATGVDIERAKVQGSMEFGAIQAGTPGPK